MSRITLMWILGILATMVAGSYAFTDAMEDRLIQRVDRYFERLDSKMDRLRDLLEEHMSRSRGTLREHP